jgi:ribosomal protein L16 Arg81 hydroxylase
MSDWGLDALTQPLGAEQFLAQIWPAEPFVGEGPLDRLEALVSIPELASVQELLAIVPGDVRVWPPHDAKDEATRIVPSAEALARYQSGWTIYLNNVEAFVPALRPLIRRIELDLGLHVGDVATEVFASVRAAGARPHCDFDYGFNLQLSGTKTWKLAPNTSFKNPHASVIVSDPFDADVAAYATGLLPKAMPTEGARELVARPGTVVFVPRGTWHTTVAHEPSLALTFACRAEMWSTLLVRELELQLRQSEAWREAPERWVGPLGVTRPARTERLAALLADLPHVLGALRAPELVARWTAPRDRVYAVSEASAPRLVVDPLPNAMGTFVSLADGPGRRRLLALPPEHVRVVSALIAMRLPFTASDAAALLQLPLEQAAPTIAALVGEGVLVEL